MHQHHRRRGAALWRRQEEFATADDAARDVLGALDVLALEAPADAIYGELRASHERTGLLIGPNDLLIAAHAIALGATIVTDNEREFSRVSGLPVENWLR